MADAVDSRRRAWMLAALALRAVVGCDANASLEEGKGTEASPAGAGPQGHSDAGSQSLSSDAGTASTADAGAAIGPPSPNDVTVRNLGGSRLKARWLLMSNGVGAFVGWRDTGLGLDCVFRTAADGKYRCLPLRSMILFPDSYFAAAGCTGQLSAAGACASSNAFVMRQESTVCPPRTHVYGATSKTLAAGQSLFVRNQDGTCARVTYGEASQWLTVGPEIAASAYVEATETRTTVGAFSIVNLTASDGSVEFREIEDAVQRTPCVPGRAVDDSLRCLPKTVLAQSLAPNGGAAYADNRCSQTVLTTGHTPCASPLVGLLAQGCPAKTRVFAVGPKVTTYYAHLTGDPNRCDRVDYGNLDAFLLGAEIAPSSLVPVSELPPMGPGRVQGVYYEVGGQFRYLQNWLDQQINSTCTFDTAADGKTRCIPSGAHAQSFFEDVQCTRPVASAGGCGATPRFASYDIGTECEPRKRVHPVTGVHAGPIFYKGPSGCVAHTPTTTYYALGAEMPASAFIEANEVLR